MSSGASHRQFQHAGHSKGGSRSVQNDAERIGSFGNEMLPKLSS